jgi:hypothetical protein
MTPFCGRILPATSSTPRLAQSPSLSKKSQTKRLRVRYSREMLENLKGGSIINKLGHT